MKGFSDGKETTNMTREFASQSKR